MTRHLRARRFTAAATAGAVVTGLALTGLATAGLVAGAVAANAAPTALAAPPAPRIEHDDEPGDRFPLFDFTDKYYRNNGVDPAKLANRRTGEDGLSVPDKSPDRQHRDVRSLFTIPSYDPSGDTFFFTVLADLAPDPFTANRKGREARKLAEGSPVYVFPSVKGDPLGVGTPRQADMVDTRHGYFSNNPLGLWVHVFVSYTDKALTTTAGRDALAELAGRNGQDADGTPLITSLSDLEHLKEDGLVTFRKRPLTDVGRYFVCPAYKDPRDGGIAKDAVPFYTTLKDGSVLPAEQHFVRDFESLRDTGDWSD